MDVHERTDCTPDLETVKVRQVNRNEFCASSTKMKFISYVTLYTSWFHDYVRVYFVITKKNPDPVGNRIQTPLI